MLDRLSGTVEKEDFFARVRQGYDALAAADPRRVARIDASKSIDAVFEDVRAAVDGLLDR